MNTQSRQFCQQSVQVKLQQPAEIAYIEHGFAEGNGKVDQTFLQVFVRDGPSPSCMQYRELTEGRLEVPINEFHKTDGKHAIADTFILSGRFQSFTFRAVGASFTARSWPDARCHFPVTLITAPSLKTLLLSQGRLSLILIPAK